MKDLFEPSALQLSWAFHGKLDALKPLRGERYCRDKDKIILGVADDLIHEALKHERFI